MGATSGRARVPLHGRRSPRRVLARASPPAYRQRPPDRSITRAFAGAARNPGRIASDPSPPRNTNTQGGRAMRTLALFVSAILLLPMAAAQAQDNRAALEAVATALGATNLKSIEIQGGGVMFLVGQSQTPAGAW